MEKFLLRKFILGSSFVLAFTGCGGGEAIDPNASIDAYTIVSDTFTEKTQSSLAGRGTIRFSSLLINNEQTLKLKAALDTLNGSSVSALFYFSSQTLNDASGIEVQFSRSGSTVQGQIIVRSASSTMSNSRLTFYVPANLDVLIQVQTTNSGSRVLIWRRDLVSYTLANADINTTTSGHVTPSLPNYGGLGSFSGLTLNNATVTSAQVTSAVAP